MLLYVGVYFLIFVEFYLRRVFVFIAPNNGRNIGDEKLFIPITGGITIPAHNRLVVVTINTFLPIFPCHSLMNAGFLPYTSIISIITPMSLVFFRTFFLIFSFLITIS